MRKCKFRYHLFQNYITPRLWPMGTGAMNQVGWVPAKSLIHWGNQGVDKSGGQCIIESWLGSGR